MNFNNSIEQQISNIRKQIPLVQETLTATIHREKNYESFLKEAQEDRRLVQSYLTAIEVRLAELENRIQIPIVKKTKINITSKDETTSTKLTEQEVAEKLLAALTSDQLLLVMAQLKQS